MSRSATILREIRTQLGLSQAECAKALGVAVETFRTGDAGRRPASEAIVSQARTLKPKRPLHDLASLHILADELHVHVRTLRAAARDGRLAVTFAPRPFFGKLTATATREACALHGQVVSPNLWALHAVRRGGPSARTRVARLPTSPTRGTGRREARQMPH